MGIHDVHRSEEPHSRLTFLCDQMIDTLRDCCGDESVKAIVMLDDGAHGGLATSGYDSDGDAIADMFQHLAAIFEANGKKLMLVPVGGQG